MKITKIFPYLLTLGLSATLSSCSESILDITPLTNNTANDFYKTEDQVNQGVLAVYNSWLPIPASSNWYLSEVRSDNTHEIEGGAQRDYKEVGNFTASSQTAAFQTAWSQLYSVVYRSNVVLSKVEGFEFARVNQFKAEARLFRAMAYFDLVRYWGDVPLVDKVLSIEEGKNALRTPATDIYKLIVDDLTFAAENLPESYVAAQKGRATKYAAKALLGRVYLTMAGYPLKQTDKLALAKAQLAEVMKASSLFPVPAVYRDLFTVASKNKHHIFEVQYLSGGKGLGSSLPSEMAFQFPSQWSPFTGGFEGQVEPALLASYASTDARKLATLDSGYVDTKTGATSGRVQFTKFLEKGDATVTSRNDYQRNFPIVRYADVLLMYAEILNEEAGTPPAEAIQILNKVRADAKVAPVTPATKAAMKLALENERRWEFAGEGLRWFDLVRTERAIPAMTEFFRSHDIPMANGVTNRDLLFPIPLNEMLINPGFWKQNDGY